MTSDPFLIAVGIIGTRELTDELLSEVMGLLPRVVPGIDADTLEKMRKQLESTIGVSMAPGQGLHGGDQEPWLEEIKSTIKWNYWNAYVNQLKSSGFGLEVVRVLDEDTDNILNECGNPAADHEWRVKGLVMGDVQSGKTASYCGLINKGADAGYKFIVLLTGMIEELREQTQERLDEGFVGRDSRDLLNGGRDKKAIGAGRFRPAIPNVLTSIDSDFLTANNRALGGIPIENINEPVLLVMKKNKAPLGNLIAFLDSQLRKGRHHLDLPLLLIDDEADNASVNARKDEDPATINRLIREIFKRFRRSTYVAYTATPFANVFINPDNDDLFPSNFVYCLNTPSNYIGATSMFSDGGSSSHQLVDIDDADGPFPYKHKKDLLISDLPSSLQDAIGAFLMSCAIRDLRVEPLRHRSMLVNVTRFTEVQGRLSTLIKQFLYVLTEEIKQYLADDDLWSKHPRLAQLHEVWREHYAETEFSWGQVRKAMYDAVASIKVVTINQRSEEADRLNFRAYKNSEKGRRIVAVGGLTLSRGLTLEGLCISYFYRNSKAYDTLLQMGRWFGYRSGYEDLCRVWMDPDVQDWFAHISHVVAELRMDIRRMHANRQPPSKFGMRVKAHPDALIVTALNKMRNAREVQVAVSFSKYGTETPFLPRKKEVNASNVVTLSEFLNGLSPPQMEGSRFIWKRVPAPAIASFLRRLEISNMNMAFIPELSSKDRPILAFIGSNALEPLKFWDICLPQGDGDSMPALQIKNPSGMVSTFRPRKRQFEKVPAGADYLKTNKQRVGEISDEMVGLTKTDVDAVREGWEKDRANDPEMGATIPGYAYRTRRQSPLLTIHVIQPQSPKPDSKSKHRMMDAGEIDSDALVAIGLSFPPFGGEEEEHLVPYRFNKVALRSMGLIEDEEDDDED